MTDKIFIDGLFVKSVETKYGGIIKLDIKKEPFIEFLSKHVNDAGYVNIDILTNQDGKKYAVLNTFKKPTEGTAEDNADELINEEEIPF